MMQRTVDLGGSGRRTALPQKCTRISAAFRRILALCIAFVRPSPSDISRAPSRAATALMFSSSANDDWVRFIGANKLFA
jgi:hypothetical protein